MPSPAPLAFVLYPVVKALGRVIGQRIAALLVMVATVLALAVVLYILGATVIEEAGASATGWRFWAARPYYSSLARRSAGALSH